MKDVIKWFFPYKNILLSSNAVHVWRAKLSFTTKQLNTLFSFLSIEERERASKFSFSSDTHSFIASKAILRLIISRYLSLNPNEVIFYQNYYGKPFISNKKFHFNMSHSNEYVVFALSENKMVGIDIEYLRKDFDELEIAERFFSHREIQELKSVSHFQRKKAFFNCWTRKEAFIKAIGTGLSTPLNSFDVAITTEITNRPIEINHHDEENNWSLYNLKIAKGYSSALVTQGKPEIIKYWDWNYTIEVIDRYTKTEEKMIS